MTKYFVWTELSFWILLTNKRDKIAIIFSSADSNGQLCFCYENRCSGIIETLFNFELVLVSLIWTKFFGSIFKIGNMSLWLDENNIKRNEYQKKNYQANFLCLSLAAIRNSQINEHALTLNDDKDGSLTLRRFSVVVIWKKEIGCQFNMVSWLVRNFSFCKLHQSIWIDWWFFESQIVWFTCVQSKIQMNPFYNKIHFILPFLNYDWRNHLSFFFLFRQSLI